MCCNSEEISATRGNSSFTQFLQRACSGWSDSLRRSSFVISHDGHHPRFISISAGENRSISLSLSLLRQFDPTAAHPGNATFSGSKQGKYGSVYRSRAAQATCISPAAKFLYVNERAIHLNEWHRHGIDIFIYIYLCTA